MEYGAVDLHKKESQIRIVAETGKILDRRIATTRDRFTATFCGRSRMRVLLEASTESESVAQHLETLGHEVIVADPTTHRCMVNEPAGEDRPTGCRRFDRSVPAWDLSSGASTIRAATRRPVATQRAPGVGAGTNAGDLAGPRDHASRRVSHPQRSQRDLPDAARCAGLAGADEGHARAVAERHRSARRRAGERRR